MLVIYVFNIAAKSINLCSSIRLVLTLGDQEQIKL
jgi:hypothetical protein